MPRWILVDDTDTGIAYTGPWFRDQGTQNGLGNFGSPYLSTLHGTNSDASFSYAFNGTRVIVTGTNEFKNPSGVNPSWQCIVDGVNLPSTMHTQRANRLLFCEADGLTDGPHVITVNATVSNQQTFWFDYIQYIPSASVSLDHAALSIDPGDPQFQYGTGWNSSFPGNMTMDTNSTFSFNFEGVSIAWLGFYNNTFPLTATTATYAIDGQVPITFNLNGALSQAAGVMYNQVFFQTTELPAGSHKLDVVYRGSPKTTPLTLSALLLQNGTSTSAAPGSSSGTSTVSSSSSASASASVPKGGHHSNKTGVIVGSAVAGLLVLVGLAILGYFFLRRRIEYKRNKRWTGPIDLSGLYSDYDSMTTALRTNQDIPSSTMSSDISPLIPLPNTDRSSNGNLVVSPFTSTPTADMTSSHGAIAQTSMSNRPNQGSTSVQRKSVAALQQEIRLEPPRSNRDLPTIMRDEDSGVRIRENGDIVELLPPVYTAA